jgi:hypothetical protein
MNNRYKNIGKKTFWGIVTVCLLLCITVLQGCESEEFAFDNESEVNRIKNEIMILANKYNANIKFPKDISNNHQEFIKLSMTELEQLLSEIEQTKSHPVEFKLQKKAGDNGTMIYFTENNKKSFPRLKQNSEIISLYSIQQELANLTNFNVTLIECNDEITVSTSLSGVGIYNYQQLSGVATIDGSIIYFATSGTLQVSASAGVNMYLTYSVTSIGSYNKSLGGGTVSVSHTL